MEQCQSSLRRFQNYRNRIGEFQIRKILRDVCIGLSFLRKQNKVHLNIKPDNILISHTKKFKLCDFCLSPMEERTDKQFWESDLRYVALEALKPISEGEFDKNIDGLHKADIFALGASLFEIMTGCDLPKNGDEWLALRNGKLKKLEHLNQYSVSLKSLISSMMRKNPDNRPTAEHILSVLPDQLELELKWQRQENEKLKKKLQFYEKKLLDMKIIKKKRRPSL